MKRIVAAGLGVGAAVVLGISAVPAASPQVEAAIKAVEAVASDEGKLKLFCELNKLLETVGDTEDPALQKQIEDIVTQMGPEFGAAWDVGEELDESTPDGQAFYGAVDTLSEKCQ